VEEEDEFTGITSQEETGCEHDERIEGWIAADAAVLEGAANFKKNCGFGRLDTCPSRGCQDHACGTCDSPRDVWDSEHSEMVHVERAAPVESDAVQVEKKVVDSNECEALEEMKQLQESLERLTGDETKGMQWETDCVVECDTSTAQQLQEEKESSNRAMITQCQNEKRAQQALAIKTAGKGKGGKGKGGKGKKGGKEEGAGSLPAFVTEDYHPPLPPLPLKKQVQDLHERMDNMLDKAEREEIGDGVCYAGPTTPSADALDLGEEAFPTLGMFMKEKSVEGRKKAVSTGGSQAASMNKFMRKTYGYATSR
jgi:hypothetical protein